MVAGSNVKRSSTPSAVSAALRLGLRLRLSWSAATAATATRQLFLLQFWTYVGCTRVTAEPPRYLLRIYSSNFPTLSELHRTLHNACYITIHF
eukprot:3142030-Rhodomonas_salina.1